MNQVDRNRMARLYSCFAKLPWPNRGRTLSPKDLSEFFDNMETLEPLFARAIMAIARSDSPDEDPEAELDELKDMLRSMGAHFPE